MYVHWFHELNSGHRSVVGGKGANLGRLTREGVHVPPGFCVDVSAYQQFVAHNGLKPEIERLVAGASTDDIHALHARASDLQRMFIHAPVPNDIQAQMSDAYQRLSQDSGSSNVPVAVRSSSTAEDMQNASFAGQYDSYLNVRGEDELFENLKCCWASLWNPEAILYRRSNGFDNFFNDMAVVIQQMVRPVASGVLFSVNPVSGDLTDMVVNASWGLGEGVVEGSVEVDTFVLDRETTAIKKRSIPLKRRQIEFAEGSGTRESDVSPERRQQPSLTDTQLQELRSLAISIEEIYQTPQDIEWSHDGDRFHVLQTRPITSLDQFPLLWDSEADKRITWSAPASRETRPVLPLDEFRQKMFYEARKEGFSRIGSGQLANDHRMFNGYAYDRVGPLDGTPEELAQRRKDFRSKLEAAWAKGNTAWLEYYFPYIDATNKRLKAFDLQGATNDELIEHMNDVTREAAEYWAIHWIRGGREVRARWLQVFRDLTGNDSELDALTATQGPNKSTGTITAITRFAGMVKASPDVLCLFESLAPEELYSALRDSSKAAEFMREFDEFIEDFGYKSGAGFGSHSSLSIATWRDDPSIVLSIISRYLPLENDVFEANVHSVPPEALAVIKQAYEVIGDDETKRTLFAKELSLARKNNAEQEDHNFHLDQTIVALLRLPCIEAAERLQNAGVIQERDDVFFIKMEELQDALAYPGESNHKELIRARKLLHTFRQMLKPPPSVGGDSETTAITDMHELEHLDASVLEGTPASGGTVTGKARVVSNTEVVPDLKPGEILVSYNAGPMWTPLFPIIGGLVLDGGNVLLHAAVVAREYKIPAVFMTGNATRVIKDGQTITVDGTSGTIYLR